MIRLIWLRYLLSGAALMAALTFTAPAQAAAFGTTGFDGSVANADGSPATQAGGHPYSASTEFNINLVPDGFGGVLPVGSLKDAVVSLPAGFIGDPTSTPRCSAVDFATVNPNSFQQFDPECPNSTVIGFAEVGLTTFGSPSSARYPIYNLVPPSNLPAQFGFVVEGTRIRLNAEVRTGSDYGINVSSLNTPQAIALTRTQVTLWGVPA